MFGLGYPSAKVNFFVGWGMSVSKEIGPNEPAELPVLELMSEPRTQSRQFFFGLGFRLRV